MLGYRNFKIKIKKIEKCKNKQNEAKIKIFWKI